MDTVMILALCLTGFAGIFVGLFAAAKICNGVDKETEKSGVWSVADRAYKLTRIQPER